MKNANTGRQTYWQQLTQGGLNAVLFWILNAAILAGVLFWWKGETENAPYVVGIAGVVQLVNVVVTYFQKENVRNRNKPEGL